jgi:pyruvate formate lyase activating enzyme
MEKQIGLINHILPKSFVDGPGNRAVIFMQGCNFHCLYCHNPFTINICNNCGLCVSKCPQNALMVLDGKVIWDKNSCVECDTCIKICPNYSSPRVQRMDADELWNEITRLQPFISGVSISGGEPSLQIPFLVEFFQLVKHKSDLTTLIETNGFIGPQAYEPLLPHLDLVLIDLKSIDPATHEKLTGKSLHPVMASIRFFAETGKLFAVQQVIVPGFTDNIQHMQATAQFLNGISADIHLKLLRFRPHGTSGDALEWKSPSDVTMNLLVNTARSSGLQNVERSL